MIWSSKTKWLPTTKIKTILFTHRSWKHINILSIAFVGLRFSSFTLLLSARTTLFSGFTWQSQIIMNFLQNEKNLNGAQTENCTAKKNLETYIFVLATETWQIHHQVCKRIAFRIIAIRTQWNLFPFWARQIMIRIIRKKEKVKFLWVKKVAKRKCFFRLKMKKRFAFRKNFRSRFLCQNSTSEMEMLFLIRAWKFVMRWELQTFRWQRIWTGAWGWSEKFKRKRTEPNEHDDVK